MNIIDEIDQQIKDLHEKKRRIQEECSHPKEAVEKTPVVESPTVTRYTCKCKLCNCEWSA